MHYGKENLLSICREVIILKIKTRWRFFSCYCLLLLVMSEIHWRTQEKTQKERVCLELSKENVNTARSSYLGEDYTQEIQKLRTTKSRRSRESKGRADQHTDVPGAQQTVREDKK